MAVSELVATEEWVSSARAAVKAASLREQGENRDTQTRHQGDCDRGRVAQTRACRGISLALQSNTNIHKATEKQQLLSLVNAN